MNSRLLNSPSLRADIVPESSKSTGWSAFGIWTDFLRAYLLRGGLPAVGKFYVSHAIGGDSKVSMTPPP